MNTIICPKCGNTNAAGMRFCSNCGQGLANQNPPVQQNEPPPTVFMGQSPPKPQGAPIPPPQTPLGQQNAPNRQNAPSNPFEQQTPPNNPFAQPAAPNNPFGQQAAPNNPPFNQQAAPPQFSTTPAPPAPPKKSNKGLIFGAIGCLGLLALSVVGLGIVGAIFYNSSGSQTAYTTPTPPPYGNNSYSSNSYSSNSYSSDSTIAANSDSTSSNLLTTILESRKTVGSFNQKDVRTVTVSDYFPEGTGAAQATYSSGSKNVFLTVGQFDTMDAAKKNFNDQIRGVKGNGGKIVYENTAADGTISAIYEKGGYYFAEYCNTNRFCNRIHSNNREAVKSFLEGYAKE